MKKYFTDINTLAALLMAGVAFIACSSDDKITDEIPQPVTPTGKYTMTVNATMGDDGSTRALVLDDKTLKVKWASTDQVAVFPATWRITPLGTLTAAASETGSTTLSGDLTGTINVNDNLHLLFPRAEWDYTGQKGILLSNENSIEKKYDYALADVTVAAIDDSKITTTADANFASQQAIVKFILKNKADDELINVKKLTIAAASNKLLTKKTLANAGDRIYHSGYTATSGCDGFNAKEGYASLVDGDLSTKWCANTGHQSGGVWYIEFHTDSPIQVSGYMLRTANDTDTNPGRNPTSWVLKGKTTSGGTWNTIDSKSGNTDMKAVKDTEYDFTATNPGTYQYFRLEISAAQSGDIMQLSEMKLFTDATEPTEFNDYGPVVVTPASAASELTVALRNENAGADTYTITVTAAGGETYKLEKSGVNFENGKYYEITAKLTKQTTIDLSFLTANKTIQDGYTLTGTLNGATQPYKISIADGATVTLNNVTINGVKDGENYQWSGINCEGDATIILSGTNSVTGFHEDYPGIHALAGKTLTINGTGVLYASSNGCGAGIGGGWGVSCGNIVIEGGTITAAGGQYCAGIGGNGGNITINGGTITARGGSTGAGIGSGNSGSCGNITISGGTVTAYGGAAAGIGGGFNHSRCGNITITSGVIRVTATKGDSDSPCSIGKGKDAPNDLGGCTCGTVTIGGVVYADGITTSPYTYQPE